MATVHVVQVYQNDQDLKLDLFETEVTAVGTTRGAALKAVRTHLLLTNERENFGPDTDYYDGLDQWREQHGIESLEERIRSFVEYCDCDLNVESTDLLEG